MDIYFKELFINRIDTYLSQYLQDGKKRFKREDISLTDDIIKKHLQGEILGIGAYQIDKNSSVIYGCYDFDKNTREDFENAKKIYKWLKDNGYKPLMENSGGGEYKVHIFLFSKPTNAKKMKLFLKWCCKQVDVAPNEIFPKQDGIEDGGFGNFVKLPLGVHAESNNKSFFYNDKFEKEDNIEWIEKRLKYHVDNKLSIPEVNYVEDHEYFTTKEEDVSDWDLFFDYCLKRNFPKGAVYDIILKNEARYFLKKGYDINKLTEEIKPLYQEKGWDFNNLLAWFKSSLTRNEGIRKEEIVSFCSKYDKNLLGLIPWLFRSVASAIESATDRELITHQKKIFFNLAKITDWSEKEALIVKYAKRTGISINKIEKELKKYEPKRKKQLIEADVLAEQLREPKHYYIRPLFQKGKLILIAGLPGGGKSLYVLCNMLSMKYNKPFCDWFGVENQANVLYYCLEENIEVIKERIQDIKKGLNIGKETNSIRVDFWNEFNSERLDEELNDAKDYDIIVIDTLRGALTGDENNSEVTRKFYQDYLQKLQKMGKSCILIHHLRKSNGEQELIHQIRGSSDIPAQMDTIFLLKSMPKVFSADKKVSYVDINLVNAKDKCGIPFEDFIYRMKKYEDEEKTECEFLRYGRFESKKTSLDRADEEILSYIKEKKEAQRKDIIEFILKKGLLKSDAVDKHISKLITDNKIKNSKFGHYSLVEDEVKENVQRRIE